MNTKDIKVLVCDDSILVRKSLRDILSEYKCINSIEVTDGQEAVKVYKEYKPDLVFMDLIMSGKTGIIAIKEIIEFDKNAKVAVTSSALTQNYIKSSIEAGAYEFIQKPINKEQVKKIIDKVLKVGE